MDSATLKPQVPTEEVLDMENDSSHTLLSQKTPAGVSPRPETAAEVRKETRPPMDSGAQKGPSASMQYQEISPNEPQLRPQDSPKTSPRSSDVQQRPQHGAGVPPVRCQLDKGSLMTDSKGVEFRPIISVNSDNLPMAHYTGSLGTVNSDPSIHFAPSGSNFSNTTRKHIIADSRGQSWENMDTSSPKGPGSENSQTASSSVTLDVTELSRAVYVRAPLGTFRESLIHMKLREFARGYHGVFGICTFNGVAGWILTTQFLSVLVALMACPDENWSQGSKPFIEVNTSRGGVFIYSFCSLALIFLLAFKFGGPRMLAASQKVSHVMTVLLICIGFSIEIINAKDGMEVCSPGRSLFGLTTSVVLFINVVYTQLQLFLFICSMVNTLYWPALYKWWFCTHSIRLWHLVKKHKIKLHIPDSVKRAVDAKGPKARSATMDSTTGTGMYMEAHGHSFTQWLFSWGRTFLFWKERRTTLVPVSVVFYVGQVDEDDLPHGFGRWQSDAFHGESIVGYWNHGQPMGPFKSREFGTGSGFMCIRIAWCKAKKGISDFETSFGISDAECCVSGAFFRKFPRVTLHGMDLGQSEGAVPRQLLAHGNNTLGCSKVAARCTITPKVAHSEEIGMASPYGRKRASSEMAAGALGPLSEENQEYYAAGPTGPPRLMWQASRIPAAVRRKAQGLFRWRSDHQLTSASREEYFKRSMKLVIDRMDPHLPNFGITNKTELHITADVEQGLHVGGWVPSSELWNVVGPKLGLQQVEPVKGDTEVDGGEDNGCAELAGHSSADSATSLHGGPQKSGQVIRKISHSQTRAKGLHQRLGHALQVRENIRHVTLRRPFKSIHHEGKSITEFLKEGPRIRRQTYDQGCKVLTIRVNQPKPRLQDVDAYTRERAKMSMSGGRRGTDILDPSNQLNRPFGWTEEIPELCVEGWRRAEEAGLPEAIIFVHGYNTSDVQSMQVLAQMAAFGNFPSYIKLFLFTWPAGENFLEFFDARENAKNPQLHAAFTDFMRSLRDNGIRQVHLLAHSLGSRMLIMSLHQIEKENLLLKISHLEDLGEGRLELSLSDQKKMHIVSLNFLNPEFFLEDFVATEYSFLRQYCSNISIFCDAHDGALWWSELFSGKQALGRSVFGLYARRHGGGQDEDPQEQDLCTPPLYASSTACFQGYEPEYKHVDTRDWLDVDVIDMTWLGHNVHSLRHSYWSLNREVIEDLRELIVTRKRARQRTSRLDRREGNVWVYRVAPSSLTSIFDSDI